VSDLVGKRRYGYLLSSILVLTGLVFTILTLVPNGNLGLQFSIAYTGGTVWEVHFAEGTPTPAEVRAVLEEQGMPNAEVAITGDGEREFVLIRTEELTLLEPEPAAPATGPEGEAPGVSPAPATAPATAASPVASSPVTSSPVADGSPTESLEATPAVSPVASPSAAPGAAGDGDQPVAGVPTEGRFGELATALQERFGPIDEVRQQNSVGPVVSNELIQQTILLIIFAAAAIMAWITYRFRDFRMGAAAIIALLHDVVVVVGAFAVLGTFLGTQVDALFVTAMLTVIGFSVHDTIVVFDRIRENRQRYLGEPLTDIVNHSLMQTLGRSITTSLTLIVTLMALLLLGGEAIRSFTLVLLIGVTAGTYSSIFVATPLLVDWHARDDRRRSRLLAQARAT
jgi:preprotein translocase SecF subunit